VTALQIANLKRLSKSSTLLLMDKADGQAKAVAKALAARGFGKVFIVQGGFEGRGGWVQSKLQVKPVAGELQARSCGRRQRSAASWPGRCPPRADLRERAAAWRRRALAARLPALSPCPLSAARPAGALGASSNSIAGTIARTIATRKSLPAPKA
jgi:hypothetical protein